VLASCGLHPEFTLLPWEEAGNSPLNGSMSFLERAGALPPPQSENGETEETPNPIQFTRTRTSAPRESLQSRQAPAGVWDIRASISAEATERQLDLELVAAFT
jgi:hypothetical protein